MHVIVIIKATPGEVVSVEVCHEQPWFESGR